MIKGKDNVSRVSHINSTWVNDLISMYLSIKSKLIIHAVHWHLCIYCILWVHWSLIIWSDIPHFSGYYNQVFKNMWKMCLDLKLCNEILYLPIPHLKSKIQWYNQGTLIIKHKISDCREIVHSIFNDTQTYTHTSM